MKSSSLSFFSQAALVLSNILTRELTKLANLTSNEDHVSPSTTPTSRPVARVAAQINSRHPTPLYRHRFYICYLFNQTITSNEVRGATVQRHGA